MAGEGTVVWIREHDPNRAGVTPGMGVRFDKLTPASQPVLDKILADKGKREPSGPNANTVSGKSGVSALPVRRPSSTFSAVEPLLGAGARGAGAPSAGPIGGALPGPAGNPFAASSPSGIGSRRRWGGRRNHCRRCRQPRRGRRVRRRPVRRSRRPARPVRALCRRWRARARSTASRPGPTSARSDRPVRLAPSRRCRCPRPATGSGRVTGTSGTPAVPTPLEDSDRTQIADGLPEFANEQPTHVGSPALSDLAASRAASITATSKRIPTPPPQPKLSLDDVAAPAASAPAEAPAAPSRTTSPNGGLGSGAAHAHDVARRHHRCRRGGDSPGRLSSSQPVVGPHPNPGSLASDLAQTVPASARISAVTSAVRTDTPHATARVEPPKKKRPAWSSSWAASPARCWRSADGLRSSRRAMSRRNPRPAQVTNAAAPAPAPAAPAIAAPEGAKSEPAAANPAAEAKVGEAKAGEPKPGEPAAAEPKPGEPKAAEAKPGGASGGRSQARGSEARGQARRHQGRRRRVGGGGQGGQAAPPGPSQEGRARR